MTAQLGPIDRALGELSDKAGDRVIEEVLEQFGIPIDLRYVAKAGLITGMDMGMAFAVEFQAEARTVLEHVGRVVELTEADRAQRTLTFQRLVEAARTER